MKKKEQGILTVEASIILTICVLLVLFLFSFAQVYNAQSVVSHAVLQSADAVALESFLREETLNGSEQDVADLANRFMDVTSVSADSYTSLRSADVPKIAREKFVYAIAKNEAEADAKLRKLGVKDGLAGINFSASRIDLGNDDVIIYISYTIEMRFAMFGMNEISVTKAAKSKTFGDILFGLSVVPDDPIKGSTSGSGNYKYGESAQISATPNYGYKFKKWDDGSTANPRVITVTGAQTYVAIFEQSEFGVNIISSPAEGGSGSGGGVYKYLDSATITATPATGYHFTRWSIYGHNDKKTKTVNSQTTTLNIDQSYTCTAVFDKNSYNIKVETSGTNSANAYIIYNSSNTTSITAPYQASFKLTAPSVSGYKFLGWKEKGANSYFSTATTVSMNVPAGNATYVACYESLIKTVRFYNRDGSLYATRKVNSGSSLGSNMPADPKNAYNVGMKFNGWKDFNKNTRVYNDMDVYGSWSNCTRHRAGDCGVVHTINPVHLNSHSGSVKTYDCMCIVCPDCGSYLKWNENAGRYYTHSGKEWKVGNTTILISPNVWCINHQWGYCGNYMKNHSAGTYPAHQQ